MQTLKRRALCLALWTLATLLPVQARQPISVWFMPAGNSRDIDTLFSQDQSWASTRKLIDGLVFSAGQLDAKSPLLARLQDVNAFQKVRQWGLSTVLAVPAIKEWGCDGRRPAAVTINMMKQVYAHGGTVQYLQLDDALVSAFGLNKSTCHMDIPRAAAAIADYIHTVTTDPAVIASGNVPGIVDAEPYPSVKADVLKNWLFALQSNSVRLAGLDLDANVHAIDRDPRGHDHLATDLRMLQSTLRSLDIPFGIIIWSGYDPLPSDEAYYNHAMDWARAVHAAIGRPDRLSFSSWVKRCTGHGDCHAPRLGCSGDDPDDCGKVSVPANLPSDNDADFSHTRLIRDVLNLFQAN